MNDTYSLDRAMRHLTDAHGRVFDPAARRWSAPAEPIPRGESVDARDAVRWLQRESGHRVRVPVGVIGPREASPAQLAAADAIGRGLASIGVDVICGGRHGVMEAVCRGVAHAGGTSIGLLPDPGPEPANPYATIVLATGIGEARNALIARAALCLVAIGDSFGTLSEVALGRQFGKVVIGLEGAAHVDGVVQAATATDALVLVTRVLLAIDA